jgi:3-deoxy-D-manno-octulosonic-acid transferase
VLAGVDRCCAQSEESGRRLIDLGASPTRVTVTGNLKFDTVPLSDPRLPFVRDEVLRAFRIPEGQTVVIAASTHAGEETPVLEAFARIRRVDPTALLVVAPRHPERCGEVTTLAVRCGLETVRRSELVVDGVPRAAVVVLDTVGELATLFQIATVVFLGGSLVPAGGHNVLEPAAWGKPVVFGPHMENLAEIAELFLTNRAACQIPSADALEPALSTLLSDPVQRAALGASARALVGSHRGATVRTLTVMAGLLPPVSGVQAGVVVPFGGA